MSELGDLVKVIRALAAGVIFAAGGANAAPDSLGTIKELVQQGQFERAYGQAQAAEDRYEGDPEFDFYYGMAALESGYFPEAIFAFERVMFVQPDNLRVRLELGRAHFLSGNYPSAERQFQLVLEQEPPPTVRANIAAFLERIRIAQESQRRDFSFYADARLGTDSNINSATTSATISTPLGDFDLVDDGREQEDEFYRAEVGVAYREPLTKDSDLDLRASYQQKDNFDSDDFDLGIGIVEAAYNRTHQDRRYRVGVRVQNVTLDEGRFQNGYGLTGTIDQSIGQNLILSLTGSVTALRYKDDHARDVDQYLLSATVLRPMGRFMNSLSLYAADEAARKERGEHNGRRFAGLLAGTQYQGDVISPYARLGIQDVTHAEDHPVFAREREDLTLTATLGATWASKSNEGFQITGEASYTDVDSNLDVFRYDRFLVELGLRQTF